MLHGSDFLDRLALRVEEHLYGHLDRLARHRHLAEHRHDLGGCHYRAGHGLVLLVECQTVVVGARGLHSAPFEPA